MGVTMTPNAARHVLDYLEKRGHGIGIRLAVRTTGCSGLSYVFEPVDAPAPDDQIFETRGVRVHVDPKSLVYVDGTEMDYVRQGLNEGFECRNPNARSECGCGESFTV